MKSTNIISVVRPDLIKYFKNEEDTTTYTIGSNKKVQLKCPDCGMLKNKLVTICGLSNQGFSCEYCSDKGISIPEKFVMYIMAELNHAFETQKVFNWAKNKKYDFHINDKIVEVHGLQHYVYSGFKRTLKEEQDNDNLKYNLAIQNGFKPENYIIIDARYSKFEWLKENCIKELSDIFDLSNIDWDNIWLNCQKSITLKIWDAWNNKCENTTTETIGAKFGLCKSTIIRHLKRGNAIGMCKYDSIYESKKGSHKAGKMNSKRVGQYTIDGEFIKYFDSAHDVYREFSISQENISNCCNNKRKTAGGYRWKYVTQ